MPFMAIPFAAVRSAPGSSPLNSDARDRSVPFRVASVRVARRIWASANVVLVRFAPLRSTWEYLCEPEVRAGQIGATQIDDAIQLRVRQIPA